MRAFPGGALPESKRAAASDAAADLVKLYDLLFVLNMFGHEQLSLVLLAEVVDAAVVLRGLDDLSLGRLERGLGQVHSRRGRLDQVVDAAVKVLQQLVLFSRSESASFPSFRVSTKRGVATVSRSSSPRRLWPVQSQQYYGRQK